MRTPYVAKCLCAVLLVGTACASARYLHRTTTGGTLVLEGNPEKADHEAARLMTEHCPGGYQLLGEKERMMGTEDERLQRAKLRYACKPPASPAPAADAAPSPG